MADRNEFSRKTKVEAFDRANGKCECCGVKLRPSNPAHYDHRIPDAVGGVNDLSNCQVLCKNCHGLKTTKTDVPAIAKTKATRDKHINAMPKGRGFRGWRKMDGTIKWRNQ